MVIDSFPSVSRDNLHTLHFYTALLPLQMVAHAKSYINNIPPCSSGKETLLEESIGKILGMFVPEFDRLLRKLHDTEKLMSPTGPPAPLSHCQVIVKTSVQRCEARCYDLHCTVI